MNINCVLCSFLVLVVLQINIKSTSAIITREDVQTCISNSKRMLDDQKVWCQNRFNDIKKRKGYDGKEHMDKKNGSLNSYIEKEKNILAIHKQSAIQDDYNVTACNDSSAVFDLIYNSFGSSAAAMFAEYTELLQRNYTQESFLLNQYAATYVFLERKLKDCVNEAECFERVQDECENLSIPDDISDLESRFSSDAEVIYIDLRRKLDSLYQEKTREVMAYSQPLKECYKHTKNNNNTDTVGHRPGSGIRPESSGLCLILISVYIMFVWS